jgi:nitroreductase
MSMTTPVSAETMIQQLSWRYAVKKFDPSRKVSAADWQTLEKAMILAPSSYGLQPYRFVVITSQDVKNRLPAISWNQGQPRDCSHFVVFAARIKEDASDVQAYIDRIVRVRGVSHESLEGYKKMMLGTAASQSPEAALAWARCQAYIAMGFLMSAAAMLGIDACPMEGIVGAEYDKLLGLPEKGYTAVAAVAVGYRAADDDYAKLKKVRFEASEGVIRV